MSINDKARYDSPHEKVMSLNRLLVNFDLTVESETRGNNGSKEWRMLVFDSDGERISKTHWEENLSQATASIVSKLGVIV
jgi:hypothetical protein